MAAAAHAPSSLNPRAFPSPGFAVISFGGSALMHLILLLTLLLGERCTRPDATYIDASQVMMVSAVALPKQTTRLPQKAERAPDPVAGAPTDEPTPPPPPNASDMALLTPDAKPIPGEEVDRTADRQKLMDKMRKDQLIKDMGAPLGSVDRPRTDPNGVDPADATFGTGSIGVNDPELAKWQEGCRAVIIPNWTPLPGTLALHPDYVVVVEAEVDASGKLGAATVIKSSGDSGFDRSAIIALAKTGRVPPPPAKWQGSVGKGAQFTLMASDKR